MLKIALIITSFVLTIGISAQSPQRISAKLFYSLLQKENKALIIDVRPSDKFAEYRIENAMPAPDKSDLLELEKIIPKDEAIFVYCQKELRSRAAAEVLDSLGYKKVYELKGGLISWRRNGLPLDDERFD